MILASWLSLFLVLTDWQSFGQGSAFVPLSSCVPYHFAWFQILSKPSVVYSLTIQVNADSSLLFV